MELVVNVSKIVDPRTNISLAESKRGRSFYTVPSVWNQVCDNPCCANKTKLKDSYNVVRNLDSDSELDSAAHDPSQARTAMSQPVTVIQLVYSTYSTTSGKASGSGRAKKRPSVGTTSTANLILQQAQIYNFR